MRHRLALLPVLAAVAMAGCGAATAGPSSGRSATVPEPSATTTRSTSPPPPAPRKVIWRFGESYGRYLDGRAPAGAVADLAPSTRVGRRIEPAARVGLLRVLSISAEPLGYPSRLVLGDRIHTIAVAVTVANVHGRPRVTAIDAGDLDSVAQPPSRGIAEPHGSQPARAAATAFLAGFLRWDYGQGKASVITAISPRLARELGRGRLSENPGAPRLDPRVVAVAMRRTRGGWSAAANITDAQRTYVLTVTVARLDGTCKVTGVQAPG